MLGADEFGPAFQRVLVKACIDDPGLREIVLRFASTGQLGFTDPASAWAWRVVSSTAKPSPLMLETEARRIPNTDPAYAGVQAILIADDVRESHYVCAQVIEWARKQVFAAGFEEARVAWNTGDFNAAQSAMMGRSEEMASMQLTTADRGWFFEDFDLRQERRVPVAAGDNVFPTGIEKLDRAMYGGLSIGELGIAIAYSKIGKSFWLNQMGFIGARLRRKVLHIVLEGGRAKTEDRYESRFADTMYREVRRGDITMEALRITRREYTILRRNLIIRGFADRDAWRVTPDDILAELSSLRKEEGWVPELVVIDYGDLLHAPGDSEREVQKTAFRRLKALSERQEFRGHRGYAVWTASQAVRPSKGADTTEHVLKPRDIADCYEKVRVGDALITLNRTIREKEARQARVSLGAYRDAEDGLLVRVSTDYDHGAFSQLGVAEPPPLPPEAKKGKGGS